MRDKDLYKQILGIQTPWTVTDIALNLKAGEVKVYVEQEGDAKQKYPTWVRAALAMISANGNGDIWIRAN